jgi:hypothetical protein
MITVLCSWLLALFLFYFLPHPVGWLPVVLVFALVAMVYVEYFQRRSETIERKRVERQLAHWSDPLTDDQKDAIVDIILELAAHPGPKGERVRQGVDSIAPHLRRWNALPDGWAKVDVASKPSPA